MVDQKRWTLICLSASVAVVNLSFSILAPVFPEVAAAKGVGATMTGAIFATYSIVTVVASPLIGHMLTTRMVSRSHCLLSGILLVGASSAAFGTVAYIADTDTFVVVCLSLRFLLGLGCAAVDTAATAAVATLYGADSQLGSAMGFIEACLGVGWVAGPALGGVLAEIGGFGLPFYLAAACTLSGYIPVLMAKERLDGSISASPHRDKRQSLTVARVLPIPEMQLMLFTAMLGAASLTAIDPTLQPHLTDSGFSIRYVGGAFAIRSLVYAASAPVVGWISDTRGQGVVMMTGCCVSALSFVLLGPLPSLNLPPADGFLVMAALVLMGFGTCMVFVPALSAMLNIGLGRFGKMEGLEDVLSGLLNSCYYLGAGLMPVLGGALTERVGFAWSCSYCGAAMAVHCGAMLVGLRMFPLPKLAERAKQAHERASQSNGGALAIAPLMHALTVKEPKHAKRTGHERVVAKLLGTP